MDDPFRKITERVRAFIGAEDSDFDELARDLFALQYEHVEPYRHLCESRGVTPKNANAMAAVPAIPTTAFKQFEITSLPPNDRPTVFHSSGTTGQSPSRHFHNADSLTLYELSLCGWFHHHVQPTARTVALTPPPAQAPHSSLAHMLQCVQAKRTVFTGAVEGGEWIAQTGATLDAMREGNGPITLMGTAFSLVHLCDAIEPIVLPPGSRVMETGGYKSRSRELSKAELHALINAQLGVPMENIIREYGMCELGSQAYATATGHFQFPRWARARIVSPEHNREVSLGETGILEIIDLANVRSVFAIRTADLAVRHEDGFELIGRAINSEPRGCSLNARDLDNLRANEARSRPHA